MEELKELEIKRQQLKLLRERERQFSSVIENTLGEVFKDNGNDDGADNDNENGSDNGRSQENIVAADKDSESHTSNSKQDNSETTRPYREMVDVSTQTEDEIVTHGDLTSKLEKTIALKHLTSYDIGVQTDPLLSGSVSQYSHDEPLSEKRETQDEPNSDITRQDKPTASKSPGDDLVEDTSTTILKPLVIENEKNSLQFKTFAMESATANDDEPQTANSTTASRQSWYTVIHDWICPITPDNNHNLYCVSIDHNSGSNHTVIVFQSLPRSVTNFNNLQTLNIATTNSVNISHVFVIDAGTGKLIDQLEFLGQLVTRCKVLTRAGFGANDDMLSVLLVTSRGKTILYELRRTRRRRKEGEKEGEEDEVWDRNVVSRNYNSGNGGIFALCENRLRLICGGSDGAINILNSLDLSGYKGVGSTGSAPDSMSMPLDSPSSMGALSRIELVPLELSDFLKTLDVGIEEEEEEGQEEERKAGKEVTNSNNISKTSENRRRKREAYGEYISRLSLWGEIGISAMVVSPFDEDCLFMGCQDGGIYKIFLRDIRGGRLKLSPTNNEFLPDLLSEDENVLTGLGKNNGDEGEQEEEGGKENNISLANVVLSGKPNNWIRSLPKIGNDHRHSTLFHTASVTSLSISKEGLLLSSSLDWTCILWDTRCNNKLCKIDLGYPVIQTCWLDPPRDTRMTRSYYCCALTWKNFYIIGFHLEQVAVTSSSSSTMDTGTHYTKWSCEKPAEIVRSIKHTELSFTKFTTFKLISSGKDTATGGSEVTTNDGNNSVLTAAVGTVLVVLGGDKNDVAYVKLW